MKPEAGKFVLVLRKRVQIVAYVKEAFVDFYYHDYTDFETPKAQKWMRELLRDVIESVANRILPGRVRYWEQTTGMFGKGFEVKKLRRRVMGCCTADNRIMLQPFVVIFKPEWRDTVILHEIAHYRYKNHKKEFWDFLSRLSGTDARKAKKRMDEELTPYYDYYIFLTK